MVCGVGTLVSQKNEFGDKLVSIIIPTYNRKNTIRRAVESVIEQDYKNIEILVCDDFSTDGTKEEIQDILDDYHNVKWLQREDYGKGANYARNNGIKHASGEYIAFLDSDDELVEKSIYNRVAIFEKYPEIDMVYGDVFLDGSLHRYDKIQELDQHRYMMEELSLCCFITIMVKAEVIKNIYPLSVDLKSWQDDELVLLLDRNNKKMYHCGKSVANIRRIGDCISVSYKNQYMGLKCILEMYSDDIVVTTSVVRLFLWNLRLCRDYFGMFEQKYANSVTAKVYMVLRKILERICNKFFRHIYG